MRLWWLHLRSRRTAATVATLLTIAGLTWLGLDVWIRMEEMVWLLLTLMPAAAAATIGAGARSPIGEAERTASFQLPLLRLGHLGGLLLLSGLTLALANTALSGPETAWTLLRNGAGLAGLALAGAWLLGGGLAWLPPAGYAAMAYMSKLTSSEPPDAWWQWAIMPGPDTAARWTALALLAAGFAIVLLRGARDSVGEA